MEVKKVMPVVKPAGTTQVVQSTTVPTGVKPVVAVKIGVQPTIATPVITTPSKPVIPQPPVQEEKPKGGLFSQPNVTEKPKEEKIADVKNAVNKTNKKASSKPKSDEEELDDNNVEEEEVKKPKYQGIRYVTVYGNEVFTEADPNVTEEQIRVKLEKEYSFFELTKKDTVFRFNDKTGVLKVFPSFNKKG